MRGPSLPVRTKKNLITSTEEKMLFVFLKTQLNPYKT